MLLMNNNLHLIIESKLIGGFDNECYVDNCGWVLSGWNPVIAHTQPFKAFQLQ